MKLKWYGQAAFKLSSEDGLSVITDPYTPEIVGYRPITDQADIVIISSDDDEAHCRHDLIPGKHEVVNALEVATQGNGSVEVKGMKISAVEAMEYVHHKDHPPGQNGMYCFELDGLKIGHMGDVGNALNDQQINFFAGVDVLLALVGGEPTIKLEDLMHLLEIAKPKIIVPMHFRTLTYRPRNMLWIESFLEHFEDAQVDFAFAAEHKLSRADLPESTRVLVLDYVH